MVYQKTRCLVWCGLLFTLSLLIACTNPQSPPLPEVLGVTVDPSSAMVARGHTQQFTAVVDVIHDAPETVTWEVTGRGTGSSTAINQNGLLTIDAEETSTSLTVTATSTFDDTHSGSAEVTVIGFGEKLPDVDILSLSETGIATWTYDDDDDVSEYSVQLYSGTNTEGNAVSVSQGVFTYNFLSAMRSAGAGVYSFTVTAIGDYIDFDSSDESEPSNTQTVIQRQPAASLAWNGTVASWSAGIDDTTDLDYLVALYRDSSTSPVREVTQAGLSVDFATEIGEAADSSYTFTVTALGNDILILPASLVTSGERPIPNEPTVVSVTVTSPRASVMPGETEQFTAEVIVSGSPLPATTVNWTLADNVSSQTILTQDGLLTVDDDETAQSITVTATSTVDNTKFNSKTVTVGAPSIEPLPPPNDVIFNDQGLVTWSASNPETNVSDYTVQLHQDTTTVGSPVTITKGGTYSHNFLDAMLTAAKDGPFPVSFTVSVTALPANENSFSSTESTSPAQSVERRAQVLYIWWPANGIARWVNPDGDGDYTIQLLKNGEPEGVPRNATRGNEPNEGGGPLETVTDFNFAWAGVPSDSSAQYSFKVTALGRRTLELDAQPSDESGARNYHVLENARVWTIIEGGSGSNKRYIAGADNGRIAWSADGNSWTLASQGENPTAIFGSNAVRGIAHDGGTNGGAGFGRFVAVGYNGTIARSDDGGATWTNTGMTGGFGATHILTIAYGNNIFVAAGDGGQVRYSTDGIAWDTINAAWQGDSSVLDETADGRGPGDARIVLFDGNQFIIFREGSGQHVTSTDGINWDYIANNAGYENTDDHNNWRNDINLVSGAFGNNTIVIADGRGTWLPHRTTAADLTVGVWTWSPHLISEGGTSHIQTVTFGGGKFFAAGNGGRASMSDDNGATWTTLANPFGNDDIISAAHGMADGSVILAGPGRITVVQQ